MKIEYINPFMESVQETFTRMLTAEAEQGVPGAPADDTTPSEVVGLLGLSGKFRGTVSLSFPATTAINISNKLLGSDVQEVDEMVSDSVAELVNIVAGNAKAKFSDHGEVLIDIGLPSVVRGQDYIVEHPKKSSWLEVPYTSEFGPFKLRVTLEEEQ